MNVKVSIWWKDFKSQYTCDNNASGRTRWGLWSGAGDVIVFYRLKAEASGLVALRRGAVWWRDSSESKAKANAKKKKKKKSNKEKKVYKTRAGNTRRLEGGNTIKREGTNWISEGRQLIGRMKPVCSLRAGKNKTQKDFIVPPRGGNSFLLHHLRAQTTSVAERKENRGARLAVERWQTQTESASRRRITEMCERFEWTENSNKTPE